MMFESHAQECAMNFWAAVAEVGRPNKNEEYARIAMDAWALRLRFMHNMPLPDTRKCHGPRL